MPAKEPKRYLQKVRRSYFYGGLGVIALIVVGMYLFVPHYIPLKVASAQEMTDAHRDIIKQYFIQDTTCKGDNLSHSARILAFNKYFKVNQYANRVVTRGCNDKDQLLAKTSGKWQPVFLINLDVAQDSDLQKACLIDDITKSAGNAHVASERLAHNIDTCNRLLKTSYLKL